jgi:hypothetical protein
VWGCGLALAVDGESEGVGLKGDVEGGGFQVGRVDGLLGSCDGEGCSVELLLGCHVFSFLGLSSAL